MNFKEYLTEKSKEVKEFLQIMDSEEDMTYQKALEIILKKYPKIKKDKLEKELDRYI